MKLSLLHETDANQQLHKALALIYSADRSKMPPALHQAKPINDTGILGQPSRMPTRSRTTPKTMKLTPDAPFQGGMGIPWRPRHRRFFGIKEEYRFKTQRWTNDDKQEYSVSKLAKYAKKNIKIRTIPISELLQATGATEVHQNTPSFVRRSQAVDTDYPILVGYTGNMLRLIDGRHRVRSIRDAGKRYIRAYLFDLSKMPKEALIKR